MRVSELRVSELIGYVAEMELEFLNCLKALVGSSD